jgi:hypothetical protein
LGISVGQSIEIVGINEECRNTHLIGNFLFRARDSSKSTALFSFRFRTRDFYFQRYGCLEKFALLLHTLLMYDYV